MRFAVSLTPRKLPPGPTVAMASPASVASDTSTGRWRRRSIAAISLSITDCGRYMVLCESMRPQPETMSGTAPQTVAAFIAFS